MEVITWRNRKSYKDRIKDKPENEGRRPDQLETKVVPGQAISIKELMDRYEKGRPIPVE